jgi:ribosome-associated protein
VDLTQRVLEDGKADRIVTVDLAGKSTVADAFVIASGHSQRQIDALTERLIEGVKGTPWSVQGIEGRPACDWVLIDLGDVVVHLFKPEARALYNLEKMWTADLSEGGMGIAV